MSPCLGLYSFIKFRPFFITPFSSLPFCWGQLWMEIDSDGLNWNSLSNCFLLIPAGINGRRSSFIWLCYLIVVWQPISFSTFAKQCWRYFEVMRPSLEYWKQGWQASTRSSALFKFGRVEYAKKLYQLLSHQIRNIHIWWVISCIHDFTLVSKHSTKLLL